MGWGWVASREHLGWPRWPWLHSSRCKNPPNQPQPRKNVAPGACFLLVLRSHWRTPKQWSWWTFFQNQTKCVCAFWSGQLRRGLYTCIVDTVVWGDVDTGAQPCPVVIIGDILDRSSKRAMAGEWTFCLKWSTARVTFGGCIHKTKLVKYYTVAN